MSRIRRGWELTKKSGRVLRSHRSLVRFPLFGGVASIALTIILLGPGLYLIDDGEIAPGAPLVVIGVYLLAFVGVCFGVGLAACADLIFRGEEASFGDGMAVARSRLPQIAGWAALSATVGLLLSAAPEPGRRARRGRRTGARRRLDPRHLPRRAPDRLLGDLGRLHPVPLRLDSSRSAGASSTGNIAIGGAVFLLGNPAGRSCSSSPGIATQHSPAASAAPSSSPLGVVIFATRPDQARR